MIPVLSAEAKCGSLRSGGKMLFVPTHRATMLTGLSTAKLREWTSRRSLILADVPPKGRGSPARYSWHTVLVLRLAVTLRERFHLELQAHREMFESLCRHLRGQSFLSIWGKVLILHGTERWSLHDQDEQPELADDVLLIRLDPHLEVLAAGFAMPRPLHVLGQLELFPIRALSDGPVRTAAASGGSDETVRHWQSA